MRLSRRLNHRPPTYCSSVFTEDQATQRDASPIAHVGQAKGIPPFLIAHVADRLGSKAQSAALAEALRQAGVKATVYPAENKTHATVNQEFGTGDDPPTKQALAFLNEILGRDGTESESQPTGRLHESSVTIDGLNRKYLLFVPTQRAEPMPLVFVLHDGGHTWPGKPAYAAERLIGKASQDFDATKAIWEFFKTCPPRRLESQ